MLDNRTLAEFHAAEIYRVAFQLLDFEILKFESPDFIVWKKHYRKIGLEITCPSNQSQNELLKIARIVDKDSLGKMYNYDKHKRAGRIDKSNVEIHASNSTVIHEIILKTVLHKFQKLNKNFTVFDKNVLMCTPICSFLYSRKDHAYFIKRLNEIKSKYLILFDEIVVVQYDKVIKYSLNKWKEYRFDEEAEITDELSLLIVLKLKEDKMRFE